MVRPGSECAGVCSEEQAGKGEHSCHERPAPTAAKIREFRNGLGKEDLVSIALEVAQNASTEDGSDDDDTEQRSSDIVERIGIWRIDQDFAVPVANGPEVLRRNVEESKREPDSKVNIGREALETELQFESEELPKECHVVSSLFNV